jgi:purine-binding chemotaxis protein CheW
MERIDLRDNELVLFRMGEKRFALPAACVQEVLQLVEPTTVPGWPPSVYGLIDVRGLLIPLVDVSEALGLGDHDLSVDQYILLIRALSRPFGIVVDGVEGVQAVARGSAQGVPAMEVIGSAVACSGIVDAGGRVIVLDPDALISVIRLPLDEMPRAAEQA